MTELDVQLRPGLAAATAAKPRRPRKRRVDAAA